MADSFDRHWDPHTDRDYRIMLYELNLSPGRSVRKSLEPVRINGKFTHIDKDWLSFEVDGMEVQLGDLSDLGVTAQFRSLKTEGGSERRFIDLVPVSTHPTVRIYYTIPKEARRHESPSWLSKGTLPV